MLATAFFLQVKKAARKGEANSTMHRLKLSLDIAKVSLYCNIELAVSILVALAFS